MLIMTVFKIIWFFICCFIHGNNVTLIMFKLLLQDQYTSTEKIELFNISVVPELWYSKEGETSIKFNNCVLTQENLTFTYRKW